MAVPQVRNRATAAREALEQAQVSRHILPCSYKSIHISWLVADQFNLTLNHQVPVLNRVLFDKQALRDALAASLGPDAHPEQLQHLQQVERQISRCVLSCKHINWQVCSGILRGWPGVACMRPPTIW